MRQRMLKIWNLKYMIMRNITLSKGFLESKCGTCCSIK